MASPIADGCYVIHSMVGSSAVLDVSGGGPDNNGQNITIWSPNGKDGQKFALTDYGDAGVQICVPLTGRCVDITNAKYNGGNVRQWEDNNTAAQRFELVAAQSHTHNGEPCYYIKSKVQNTCLDVQGANPANGTNVFSHAINSPESANQLWWFEEVESISDGGTYRIISALDEDYSVTVAAASKANGANVSMYPFNEAEAQIWLAVMDSNSQLLELVDVNSRKALDDKGAGVKAGSNAQIWSRNLSQAQKVLVQRAGSMKYRGDTVPTYTVQVQAGMKLVLDVAGASKRAGTNVWWYTANNSIAQRFAFIPDSFYNSSYPTPTNVKMDIGQANIAGCRKAKLSFDCDWDKFQVRCRFVATRANESSIESDWKSASAGIRGNLGWGDAWSATYEVEATSGDHKEVEIVIPEEFVVADDGSNFKTLTMQVGVRAFGEESDLLGAYRHGPEVSSNFSYSFVPTISVSKTELCGEGVKVYYSSNLNSGKVVIGAKGFGMTEYVTENGKYGASGHVLIPKDKIKRVPVVGTLAPIDIVFRYGGDTELHTQSVLAEAPNKDTTLSASVSESDYGTGLVACKSRGGSCSVYMSNSERVIKFYKKEETSEQVVYECIGPMNLSYNVIAWMQDGDNWNAVNATIPPISGHSLVWLYEGGYAVLDLNASERQVKQEDSISRSSESYSIYGREYIGYKLQKAKDRSVNASGVIVDADPKHGTWESFIKLLEAGHAVYRNPRGDVFNVAVTDIKGPYEKHGYTTIDVTQKVESR